MITTFGQTLEGKLTSLDRDYITDALSLLYKDEAKYLTTEQKIEIQKVHTKLWTKFYPVKQNN